MAGKAMSGTVINDKTNEKSAIKVYKAINRKLMEAGSKGNAMNVLEVVAQTLPNMSGLNMATALHRIAKHCIAKEDDPDSVLSDASLKVWQHPAFPMLTAAVTQRAAETIRATEPSDRLLPPQATSIVAWSLACVNSYNPQLFSLLAQLAEPHMQEFKFYEVTNMLWAFSKFGAFLLHPHLYQVIALRLKNRVAFEFKAHCLTMAAKSLVKAGTQDEELLMSIGDELCGQIEDMRPASIYNVCSAFSRHKLFHKKLFEEVTSSMLDEENLRFMRPPELLAVLEWAAWSSTSLPAGLFAKLGVVIPKLVPDMTPSQITELLCTFLHTSSPAYLVVMPRLLDTCASHVDRLQAEDLASVLMAASYASPQHKAFLDVCAIAALAKASTFSSSVLADVIQALTRYALAGMGTSASTKALQHLLQEQHSRSSFDVSTEASSLSSAASDRDDEDVECRGHGGQLRGSGASKIGSLTCIRPPPGLEHLQLPGPFRTVGHQPRLVSF